MVLRNSPLKEPIIHLYENEYSVIVHKITDGRDEIIQDPKLLEKLFTQDRLDRIQEILLRVTNNNEISNTQSIFLSCPILKKSQKEASDSLIKLIDKTAKEKLFNVDDAKTNRSYGLIMNLWQTMVSTMCDYQIIESNEINIDAIPYFTSKKIKQEIMGCLNLLQMKDGISQNNFLAKWFNKRNFSNQIDQIFETWEKYNHDEYNWLANIIINDLDPLIKDLKQYLTSEMASSFIKTIREKLKSSLQDFLFNEDSNNMDFSLRQESYQFIKQLFNHSIRNKKFSFPLPKDFLEKLKGDALKTEEGIKDQIIKDIPRQDCNFRIDGKSFQINQEDLDKQTAQLLLNDKISQEQLTDAKLNEYKGKIQNQNYENLKAQLLKCNNDESFVLTFLSCCQQGLQGYTTQILEEYLLIDHEKKYKNQYKIPPGLLAFFYIFNDLIEETNIKIISKIHTQQADLTKKLKIQGVFNKTQNQFHTDQNYYILNWDDALEFKNHLYEIKTHIDLTWNKEYKEKAQLEIEIKPLDHQKTLQDAKSELNRKLQYFNQEKKKRDLYAFENDKKNEIVEKIKQLNI